MDEQTTKMTQLDQFLQRAEQLLSRVEALLK